MEYQDMESLLKDNGWKCIDASTFEKKNRSGYVFRVFFDKNIKEWWCHIEDEKQDICGNVYLPYKALETLDNKKKYIPYFIVDDPDIVFGTLQKIKKNYQVHIKK